MSFVVVGLGNPTEEYRLTRHNAGRRALESVRAAFKFSAWKEDKKRRALLSPGSRGGKRVLLALPQTFMNASGASVKQLVASKTAARRLILIHDDLDLPVGSLKVSFNRGDGGHRGVASVIRGLKTREFVRIRVGVSPRTPSGKLKKPAGEKQVLSFLMGPFISREEILFTKCLRRIPEIIDVVLREGHERAMTESNRS